MKTFNNEIIVHRNETFTIDKLVQNKDGSPYIVSKRLNNPYFLLTVSTTRYDQLDRYIKNYWLSLNNMPRFNSTRLFNLHDIKTTATGDIAKYQTFESQPRLPIGVDGKYYIMSGYVDGEYVYIDYDDFVFYIVNQDSSITYKYYGAPNSSTVCNPYKYECRITKMIGQQDTKDWVEQSYVYSITLVAGDTPQGDKPITKFDLVKPVLTPTKLTVMSNIEGELRWN